MNSELRLRSLALFAAYFVPGLTLASWVTRTPAVRDALELSTGQMGLVLFGLSIGSMAGILSSARFVRRFGTRPVIGLGTLLVIAGVFAVAAGTALSTALVVAGGLFLFGAGMGSAEVAVNIEAAQVERILDRSMLPTVHGCFSLGTVVGALIGIALTAISFPVVLHLALAGSVSIPLAVWTIRHIPSGNGQLRTRTNGRTAGPTTRPRAVWKDRRLVLIAAIALAMALAEGAANDWLPLLMVDGHGYNATAGSMVYTGFAMAMTIGRFGGGFLVNHFGRVTVIRASAALGTLGLSAVIFSENAILAGVSTLVWGLGAALGFPVTLSAAGDSPHSAAARVSAVSTVGYFAFLVGPPVLGFLGEHSGLRPAMIIVLVLMALATLLAGGMASPAPHLCAPPRIRHSENEAVHSCSPTSPAASSTSSE